MGLRKSKPAEAAEAEAEGLSVASAAAAASAHLREDWQPGSLGQILAVAALLSEERFAEERSEECTRRGRKRERRSCERRERREAREALPRWSRALGLSFAGWRGVLAEPDSAGGRAKLASPLPSGCFRGS